MGGLRLLNFPEISMWGRAPWGGYGANPQPARFERLWRQTGGAVVGGMPYSEGIYEDVNKVVALRHYWRPTSNATEALAEYIAFEYSPDVVADVAAAVGLLEQTWPIPPYPQPLDNATKNALAERAFGILSSADGRLTPQARRAWRWRVLLLRATIDNELALNGGVMAGPVLCAAFAELTTIYHAQNASGAVKPPKVPCH